MDWWKYVIIAIILTSIMIGIIACVCLFNRKRLFSTQKTTEYLHDETNSNNVLKKGNASHKSKDHSIVKHQLQNKKIEDPDPSNDVKSLNDSGNSVNSGTGTINSKNDSEDVNNVSSEVSEKLPLVDTNPKWHLKEEYAKIKEEEVEWSWMFGNAYGRDLPGFIKEKLSAELLDKRVDLIESTIVFPILSKSVTKKLEQDWRNDDTNNALTPFLKLENLCFHDDRNTRNGKEKVYYSASGCEITLKKKAVKLKNTIPKKAEKGMRLPHNVSETDVLIKDSGKNSAMSKRIVEKSTGSYHHAKSCMPSGNYYNHNLVKVTPNGKVVRNDPDIHTPLGEFICSIIVRSFAKELGIEDVFVKYDVMVSNRGEHMLESADVRGGIDRNTQIMLGQDIDARDQYVVSPQLGAGIMLCLALGDYDKNVDKNVVFFKKDGEFTGKILDYDQLFDDMDVVVNGSIRLTKTPSTKGEELRNYNMAKKNSMLNVMKNIITFMKREDYQEFANLVVKMINVVENPDIGMTMSERCRNNLFAAKDALGVNISDINRISLSMCRSQREEFCKCISETLTNDQEYQVFCQKVGDEFASILRAEYTKTPETEMSVSPELDNSDKSVSSGIEYL